MLLRYVPFLLVVWTCADDALQAGPTMCPASPIVRLVGDPYVPFGMFQFGHLLRSVRLAACADSLIRQVAPFTDIVLAEERFLQLALQP